MLLCAATGARAQGQSAPPEKGVVWERPYEYAEAARDLRRMAGLGVEAVRTVPVTDNRLMTLADSLGLTFYQELPSLYATGPALERDLPRLEATLRLVLDQSEGHASAGTIGLARLPDTGDPRTCAVLRRLADAARARRPGVRLYYLTALTARDACADAVDFVLLPALDADAPLGALARWQAAHPQTPAGLVVGWASDPSQQGRHAPRSPEAAALRLDTLLSRVETLAPGSRPTALLVYRWRDAARSPLGLHPPHRAHYGLLDGQGHLRPAYEVVEGRFTGQRDVFALRGGGATRQSPANGLRLLAWAVLLLLGAGMAAEQRFRQMAQRYFGARGFYRESVRDARGALLGTTLALLAALGVCVGLIGAVLLEALAPLPAFPYLAAHLDASLRAALAALLSAPWRLALAIAAVFALVHALTALAYALAVRRRYPLTPTQTMALSLWSRWTFVPLAFAALVVQTLPAPWALRGALAVGSLALVASLYATVRTLLDLVAITRVPGYVALALVLLHPAAFGAVAVLLAWFDYGAALRYFALLTREGIS